MLALGFANLVFSSYVLYLAVEKKREVFKDKTFWGLIVALVCSLLFTMFYVSRFGGIEASFA